MWNVIFQLEAKIRGDFLFYPKLGVLSQVKKKEISLEAFFGIRARMIFTTDF